MTYRGKRLHIVTRRSFLVATLAIAAVPVLPPLFISDGPIDTFFSDGSGFSEKTISSVARHQG